MTAYLFLLGAICCSAIISIVSSAYSQKNAGTSNISGIYNVIVTLSASFIWGVFYISELTFEPGVLLYSLGYGIFYTMAFTGLYGALASGPVSLTAFAKQLSLLAVAVWGYIFWHFEVEVNVIVGMVLIVGALYLCFKPEKGTHTKPVTLKWLIFALMLIGGNAGCSILQKMQQAKYNSEHGDMMMFFGCLLSMLVCVVMYFTKKQCRISEIKKASLLFPVIGGLSSGLMNLFFILLINSPLSESVFFPCIAVGGLILTTVYSVVFCRERLMPHQWVGLAISAVALVFLNL